MKTVSHKNRLDDWLDRIAKQHTPGILLGLERIGRIACDVNLARFSCPVITVAGTNGKGSVVRCLEQIYLAAGLRVGAYSSPHLHHFNERIRINGQAAKDELLIDALEQVAAMRHEQELSFFEFTTLAAFILYQKSELDVLILEIGLGGRLDAVNIVDSDVAVVTSIGLDHMDWLGNTRELIAFEKAGIFRSNKPAICGDANPPSTLQAFAESIGAVFCAISKQFHYKKYANHWEWRSGDKQYSSLPLPAILLENAATSLAAIEQLQCRLPADVTAIAEGLVNTRLPGRFEECYEPVLTILDVAHNEPAAIKLAEQLKLQNIKGKTRAVLGMLKDKPIAQTASALRDLVDEWYLASIGNLRGADAEYLRQQLHAIGIKSCYNFGSVSEAYQAAVCASQKDVDRIVVFGSFHTVAPVRSLIKGENE